MLIDKNRVSFYYAEKEKYMQSIISIVGLVVLAFIISVPCGYARQNYSKYSLMWWVLIHLPIPVIVLLRIKAGLNWHFIPLTLGSSVAGQIIGGAVYRRRKQNVKTP
jgi:ABC-type glycerol-3-phosphate transport system permease component